MTTPLTREQVEQPSIDWQATCENLRQTIEQRNEQIDKLATFIVAQVPGEPSQSEGAVDTAIRIITQQAQELESAHELNRIAALALTEKEQEIEQRNALLQLLHCIVEHDGEFDDAEKVVADAETYGLENVLKIKREIERLKIDRDVFARVEAQIKELEEKYGLGSI